ncbi:MAG: peptidylprolyl isomerase [Burkholderiales bacterium]|nr:peptidylprolyl isomerase [Burkholderiales bacterium]HQU61568.1 peptidylprolyl isomerase [Nitrosomonas sp.]
MGQFCMELFERQAPGTVANFIRYIDSGAYAQSIFHRSMPGFVIQGGGFKVTGSDTGAKVSVVDVFDPIKNEFGISNTRGTVAMAKVGRDPDSATSQWFVSLADNSANLDNQNGGFTVFAKILYDGMAIFDTIAALQRVNFGGALSTTPTINFDVTQTPQVDNFVVISSVDVHDVTGVFDGSAVGFTVDTGNNNFFDVRLQLVAAESGIVFELDQDSITFLSAAPENRATFSAGDGTLIIPSVMIDATTIVKNVVLTLIDPVSVQFALVSFE